MNEKELKLINEWLEKNEVKKCPDSWDISNYSKASLAISTFSNQKSCVPKDLSWKENK